LRSQTDCPFCSIDAARIVFADEFIFAFWDAYPVSAGHVLIVPRRHVADWGDLEDQERAAVTAAIDRAMGLIRSRHGADGFNVGFNHGPAAGQTVFHFHLHVIPRRTGDVADPRGGVRHVIPTKANYLAERETSSLSAPPTTSPTDSQAATIHQQRLVTGGDDPLLPHLITYMDQADRCEIAVAFLLDSGARLILNHLEDLLARGGAARVLIGDYLDVTDPVALRRLADLDGNLDLRVYQSGNDRGFHLKSYTFLSSAEGVSFVGSSNISEPALTTSIEWNYKVISSHDVGGFGQIRQAFDNLFDAPATTAVTPAWIDAYERRRVTDPYHSPNGTGADVEYEAPQPKPQPHTIQQRALIALEQTREDGFSAGLVVLATGLGKTWLAAFDSDRVEFQRILFVAHREEILSQAIETFRNVRPTARIGRLAGDIREADADFIFASVQTLGRIAHLSRFAPDEFDYIVIDEFHHAAASTYRRVIDHFRPKFLLGLTATPERTDGADLLALCQENLVFEAGIHIGIESGRLCPFHYFGIPDGVDYSNIPWRSAKFDPEALEAALATEARARNAFEQFQARGGSRCIGFCCSQRHADFMASFFILEGLRAVAVHTGPTSAPRTTSLKQLADGEIDVIFAVDMFNEGVDVPVIDTVMMLRPTESTVIWMQQLGRGLRVAEDKERLTVIDFIGNHRAFLMKLRALAALVNREAESKGRLREVLEEILGETIALPPGCEITYNLAAVDILQNLLRPAATETALESYYRDFEERHGVRPNAVEVFHAGLNPRSNSEGSWLGFVERMGGLSADERAAFTEARDFFVAIEKTETTRSYKIALLLALFSEEALTADIGIDHLSRRVATLVRRIHKLEQDFSVDLDDLAAVRRLLVRNPIEAFVNAKGTGGVAYFRFENDVFGLAFDPPVGSGFGELLREVLDWRLAQYLTRSGRPNDVVCRVLRNTNGRPILFLPSTDHTKLAEGPIEVEADGRRMEATVAKIAINVVRDQGSDVNLLPEILTGWFGLEVGQPGRSDRVRLRLRGDIMVMEPMGTVGQAGDGLRAWERYSREAIGPAFGLTFDQATWNAGFVPKPGHLFLLVTLAKEGMSDEHQYADHFLSDEVFSWQSQNATTQDSKRGQMIRNHHALGLHVHLLVRPTKKTGAQPTPFTYCGEVDFAGWEGEAPITVRWKLREGVPPSLRAQLKVPA
jgi:superfamily II DNA or RNA helicase/HKD family nuclease/diadenosine tetraphosphate (Ap4A) HIT family hydrolase